MAGRRFLDAAKLLGATRSIAKQHFAVRNQQWDTFTQTSSLARAVKSQTDRVTVTARAAYVLAKRVNEDGPSYMRGYTSPTEHDEPSIPRRETVKDHVGDAAGQEGLSQDHHYDRAPGNAVGEEPPKDDLEVVQEKADTTPLPDGTIPPKGSPAASSRASAMGSDTFAQRPVSEPPKDPLQDHPDLNVTQKKPADSPLPDGSILTRGSGPNSSSQHTSQHNMEAQRQAEFQIPSISGSEERVPTAGQDTYSARPTVTSPELSSLPRIKIPKYEENHQGGDEHIKDGQMNQDVYYSAKGPASSQTPPIPSKEAVPAQNTLPEGINTDIFYSPNVAAMLSGSGKEDRRKAYEMKLKAARKGPIERIPLAEGKNQDTFSVRPSQDMSSENLPSNTATEQMTKQTEQDTRELAEELAREATQPLKPEVVEPSSASYQLRESRVPSSRFGRFLQYGGLATSMAFGAVGESFRRVTGGDSSGSLMLSPANMERLVAKLSRMRGAALKLGQMMSFQDSKMLPPQIHAVLQRVQDSADYMPPSQRDKVLSSNLGPDWRQLFTSFDDVPIAAASIGQVHRAVLATTGQSVAVKIQYPGVRDSIVSDLNNLSLLLTASRLLPKGLYLDKTIANAQIELGWECDYAREAEAATRFATLMTDETDTFTVPAIIPSASGPQVLTAEFMSGRAVTKIPDLSQSERDWIGTQILRLCLRELMEWRFMQTDPNWTNFLYERGSGSGSGSPSSTRKIQLLDFGASREFPERFVTPYVRLLIAASTRDRVACRDLSIKLGYLTGGESEAMLNAHVDSILVLAEPFLEAEGAATTEGQDAVYDFKDQTITDRVRANIGLMVRERLAPPPEETYSLHRKLSGAFLLCAKLGSRVPARELFVDAVKGWRARNP